MPSARSTEKTADGKPILLAEGNFGEQETVELLPFENIPEKNKVQQVWTLPDFGSTRETVIHLAIPEDINQKDAEVLVCRADGTWEQVPSTVDGSYLVFSVSPEDRAAAVYESPQRQLTEILALSGGAAGLLILIVVIMTVKKKKKKKAAFKQKEDKQA